MKITIDMDCTPEELRRAVGLPDLTPIHDLYLDQMRQAMAQHSVGPELIATMMKGWAPGGDAGMEMWRRLFTGAQPAAKE